MATRELAQPKGAMLRLMTVKSYALGSLFVLLAALPLSVSACGRAKECLPSRLVVSPTSVRVGGAVVVSSGPFGCHASYPPGKTYVITLALVGRAAPKTLRTVPVNQNGSFRTVLTIPSDAPPGEAYLTVTGSAFDKCDDTPNASCVGYTSPALALRP